MPGPERMLPRPERPTCPLPGNRSPRENTRWPSRILLRCPAGPFFTYRSRGVRGKRNRGAWRVKAYRLAIDSYFADREHFRIAPEWLAELEKVSHRDYTTGFYFGRPTEKDQIYGSSSYLQTSDFVGLVLAYDAATGWAVVEQRNNMKLGQEIEVFQPTGPMFRQTLAEMVDETGTPIDTAPHPQQIIRIHMAAPVEAYSILRRDVK